MPTRAWGLYSPSDAEGYRGPKDTTGNATADGQNVDEAPRSIRPQSVLVDSGVQAAVGVLYRGNVQ